MPKRVPPPSVAEFARDAAEHARRLKAGGEPMVLTVDGEPALVVLDADSYQKLRDDAERLRVLEGIREGLADADAGRVMDLEDFEARFRPAAPSRPRTASSPLRSASDSTAVVRTSIGSSSKCEARPS